MEAKEYEIQTVGDFLKVPQDRIDECLAEFKATLLLVDAFRKLGETELIIDLTLPMWTWIDDGERAQNVMVPVVTGCNCESCCPAYPFFRVCKTCGNKRCPKATNHENKCTGSNEPGQPGSSWSKAPANAVAPTAEEAR